MGIAAFRSELDKQLIKTLVPLDDHQAVLHFPFFANTFPLAFHYACLLREKAASNLIDNRIELVAWDVAPRLKKKKTIIWYSGRETPEIKKANVVYADVTIFQPRWVFSEFNLRVWAERKRVLEPSADCPEPAAHAEFNDVAEALNENFKYFDLYG
jgi:hypothetical protein